MLSAIVAERHLIPPEVSSCWERVASWLVMNETSVQTIAAPNSAQDHLSPYMKAAELRGTMSLMKAIERARNALESVKTALSNWFEDDNVASSRCARKLLSSRASFTGYPFVDPTT